MLLLAAAGAIPGVADPPAEVTAASNDDFAGVELEMSRWGWCSDSCVRTLQTLLARSPSDERVRALLRSAYLQRQDWVAFIELERTRAVELSAAEELDLATAYYRAGRLREAAGRFQRLADRQPDAPLPAYLLGVTLADLGEEGPALHVLRGVIDKLEGQQAAEAATALSLVHLRRGELAAARGRLIPAIEENPDYLPAVHALMRVESALGNQARVDQLLERATELRRQIVAAERQAMEMSSRSQSANELCAAEDWSACAHQVEAMLGLAETDSVRVRLHRYLAEAYAKMDRQGDAERELGFALELRARDTK